MVSIAVPVYVGAGTVGAVMLSTDDSDIDARAGASNPWAADRRRHLVARRRGRRPVHGRLGHRTAAQVAPQHRARRRRRLRRAGRRLAGSTRAADPGDVVQHDDVTARRTRRPATALRRRRLAPAAHAADRPAPATRAGHGTRGAEPGGGGTDPRRCRSRDRPAAAPHRRPAHAGAGRRRGAGVTGDHRRLGDRRRTSEHVGATRRGTGRAHRGRRPRWRHRPGSARTRSTRSSTTTSTTRSPSRRRPARSRSSSTPPTAGVTRVHVLDRGPGLSDEQLAHAFERFWRAADAHHDGSGIGLAIVAHLAATSGGTVALHRRPGGGLDASVTLPRPP